MNLLVSCLKGGCYTNAMNKTCKHIGVRLLMARLLMVRLLMVRLLMVRLLMARCC